ncbi:MAG: glycosyltransferase [Candidatus Pacebacteria bacterium]|nr:glycosyltransferase [Candidatus Paceibacterota bacterium]
MTNLKPLIAVIIVNYNTQQLTRDCLSSLFKIQADSFEYQTIVVDNGSLDNFSIPKKWGKKPVEVIRTEANLGFTGGNNLGISHAVKEYNPDYFLLLNSDTEVRPDFLEKLYQFINQDEETGIVSSKIYFYPGKEYHRDSYQSNQQGQVLWYAGGVIDWSNLVGFHRGVDEVDRGQFDPFGQLEALDPNFSFDETDFATGCSMLVRREVVEKVGILDKKYFLYLEDVDLCMRAKQDGFSVKFCPESIVWHINAGSSQGAGSELQQYYLTRNKLLFFFKYGTFRVRLTTFRLMVNKLLRGTRLERKAVKDYLLGNFGKQPII